MSTIRISSACLVALALTTLAAEDPATTARLLRDRLMDANPPPPAEVLADLGDAATWARISASLAPMAERIRAGIWDFRVIGARQDGPCAVVVVRIVRDNGTPVERLSAFSFIDRDGWKLLMLKPTDARLDRLDEADRQRFARLAAWYVRFLDGAEPMSGQQTGQQTGLLPGQAAEAPVSSTAAEPDHDQPSSAAGSASAAASATEEEADEEDPYLKAKVHVAPWTEIQRRSAITTFLPSAVPIRRGDFNYRVVHVAQETLYDNARSNLLGLDDNVKIGIEVGYGLYDEVDVMLQRSNGHDLQTEQVGTRPTAFDYYDVMFRWRFLDQAGQHAGGIADAALLVGATFMPRNQTKGDTSLNAGLIAERDLFDDRLRLGIGVFHAGLSAYEKTLGNHGPDTKAFPDEYSQLPEDQGRPAKTTTALPLTAKIAIDEHWQVFADTILALHGYRTPWPSVAAGVRLNTNTHEFSFYVTNTANTAFNGVLTGGNDHWTNLNLFAFSITAHL